MLKPEEMDKKADVLVCKCSLATQTCFKTNARVTVIITLVLGGYHTAVTLWVVLFSGEMAASQRAVIPVNICSEGTLGPFMRKVPCKCELLPPLFGGRRKAVRDRLALQGGTGDFP